jgi:TIR domain
MEGKIFISYRRDLSAGYVGRVFDRLEKEFGREQIFIDVDSIEFGVRFRDAILGSIGECAVFLAALGPNWMDAKDEHGNRRLEDPNDYVRMEVAAGLDRAKEDEVKFVPIMIEGASAPRVDLLPTDLATLPTFHGLVVRHATFHSDIERLIRQLRTIRSPEADVDAEIVSSSRKLRLILTAAEAKKAFIAFKSAIEARGEKIFCRIGFPGGNFETNVFYFAKDDFWCLPTQGERAWGRYWIAFGKGRPTQPSNNIIVEVNPPHSGENGRVGGVFLKDDGGQFFLGHTGKIGGGRPGIGKDAFIAYYEKGHWTAFDREKRKDRAVIFGPLGHEMNVAEIGDFVATVQRFKSNAAT